MKCPGVAIGVEMVPVRVTLTAAERVRQLDLTRAPVGWCMGDAPSRKVVQFGSLSMTRALGPGALVKPRPWETRRGVAFFSPLCSALACRRVFLGDVGDVGDMRSFFRRQTRCFGSGAQHRGERVVTAALRRAAPLACGRTVAAPPISEGFVPPLRRNRAWGLVFFGVHGLTDSVLSGENNEQRPQEYSLRQAREGSGVVGSFAGLGLGFGAPTVDKMSREAPGPGRCSIGGFRDVGRCFFLHTPPLSGGC
ncbi:unnamed protein product [Hapterophycus canaliculatus]